MFILKESESSWKSVVNDHGSRGFVLETTEEILGDAKVGFLKLGASSKSLLFSTSL